MRNFLFAILILFYASSAVFPSSDIAVLYDELSKNHFDFFNSVDKETADEYVKSLLPKENGMDEGELYYALLSVAAIARDSHTQVILSEELVSSFHFLPVSFGLFNGDIVIVSAYEDYKELLGRRVERINGFPLGEIAEKGRYILPHDNDVFLMSSLMSHLLFPEFLEAIGIGRKDGNAVLSFRGGDEISISPDSYDEYSSEPKSYLRQKFPDTLNIEDNYSAMYLPDETALLVNYHSCSEMDAFPFPDFAAAVIALVNENGYEKVVIDLRYNGGGNSAIIEPLVDGLEKIQDERGLDVYVLIGEGTFSSAILNAIELKTRLDATLVGRPTGGSVSHYGELESGILPSSGLSYTWSSKYFDNGFEGPLLPDITVDLSLDDYIQGIDTDLLALGLI